MVKSIYLMMLLLMVGMVSAVTVPLAYDKYNVPLYPDTFMNFELSNDADWGSSDSLTAPTNGYAYYYFNISEGVASANVTVKFYLASALDFGVPEPECTEPMYYPSYFGFYVYNFDTASYDEFIYTSSEGTVTNTYSINSSQIAPNGTIILRSYQQVTMGNVMCSGWNGDSNLFDVQVDYEPSGCSFCTESCSPCGGGCTATVLDDMYNGYDFVSDPMGVGDITGWDTSCITSMYGLFTGTEVSPNLFNQDISGWDVSSVTDMRYMFWYATAFNQPLNSWDVSSVTDMSMMFGFSAFNQPLNSWDVSQVTSMDYMFRNTPFNQDISGWDVNQVTDFEAMFFYSAFQQNISSWDISGAVGGQLNSMFGGVVLPTALYDSMLRSWSQLPTLQYDQRFDIGSTYCDVEAHDILAIDHRWAMYDAGLDPNCPEPVPAEPVVYRGSTGVPSGASKQSVDLSIPEQSALPITGDVTAPVTEQNVLSRLWMNFVDWFRGLFV